MSITHQRIFFGHQSVGSNLIEGIKSHSDLAQSLKLIESRTPPDSNEPCFIHTKIGKNHDPISKIEDFVNLMDTGFGDKVDIACFKFCYIDIDRETNVKQLFNRYQSAMDRLASRYPQTQFLHITTPIRVVEPKFRLLLKRILGKKSILLADNQNRQLFNDQLTKTYSNNKNPVFDLAKAESTYPTGKRCSQNYEGTKVYSLVPEYTDDGGHLNKHGQKIVAKKFIDTFIAP